MYKWKKGDGKTMAALVVACVIGSVAGFIWGICDLPSIDDIFKRAAEFALIFIFSCCLRRNFVYRQVIQVTC